MVGRDTNPRRNVYWYTAAEDAVQLVDEAAAATGVFSCCGRIQIVANATLTSVGASTLAEDVAAVRNRTGTNAGAVHVVGVSELLEFNASSTAALELAATEMVALVVASNASGVMVDFEVPAAIWKAWGPTKTRNVANGYARWGDLLAAKMHAAGKTVGLDLSGDCGGSPVDLYDVYGVRRYLFCLFVWLVFFGAGFHGNCIDGWCA